MVGWYANQENVSKPNMETIYNCEGKVVLYYRTIGGATRPYAIYKGNRLVAEATCKADAIREYNRLAASC